jgi:hypothetical protein
VRTVQGLAVPVRVTYYRRTGQRRAGARYAGVYAGLVMGVFPFFRSRCGMRGEPELQAQRS